MTAAAELAPLRRTSCLAAAAFVCGMLGCVPPLGLIAIVLGLVALVMIRRQPDRSGAGLATVGVVAGLLFGAASTGLLIEAVHLRREAAKGYDAVHIRSIAQGLALYAEHTGGLPPPNADWQDILVQDGWSPPTTFVSPMSIDGLQDYFYLPADDITGDPRQVLLYERPGIYDDGGYIVFHDLQPTFVRDPEFTRIISSLTLPDGTPHAPHLTPPPNRFASP